MRHTRNALMIALFMIGCVPLEGDDGGLDGGPPQDRGVDRGADMDPPVACTPLTGIAVNIQDVNRDAIDPEVLENYDGNPSICVGSSLLDVEDCAGEVIDVPTRNLQVCVPADNPAQFYRQDVCSDTVFFIERPRWLAGPLPSSPLCGGRMDLCLQLFLPLVARANAYAWFCSPSDAACRADIEGGAPLKAHVESVLPVDDVPGADLPERAYRVWFEQGAERVPVRDTAACDLISTLRDVIPEGEALIGRECDGPVHKVTAVVEPDDPLAIWHAERMGLPGTDNSPPEVALVDAGVPPQLMFASRLAELSFSGANPMSPVHMHGLGMALAIKEIVPSATIASMRVMNTHGRGNSADVARGIDRASREAADLRVMNLSIGLAPETRLARVVRGPGCETVDDGVGESIAIALEAARARHPNMVAFGATGNRPVSPSAVRLALINSGRELVEPGASLRYDDPCRGAGTAGWFFPAMLARCNEEAPIVGVGGINDRDQPIAVAIPGGEPALVAPAEHIFLDRGRPEAMVNRPGEDPICVPLGDGMPEPELPMVLSGTSVAAAFASGAAAWMIGHDNTLTPTEIVRLLYVTGRPLCRDSVDGIPVRAIHVGRLQTAMIGPAMAGPAYADLRACVAVESDQWIPAGLIDGCAAALEAAGLVDECASYDPVGWPTAYQPDACAGLETAGPADATELPTCDMACRTEVRERSLGPGLVGKAGPQPELNPCPDCVVRLTAFEEVVRTLTLEIELSDGFEKSTRFEEPWLIVKDSTSTEIYVIDLDDYSSASDWTAGAVVKITDIPATKIPGGESVDRWKSSLYPSIQMDVVAGGGGTPTQRTSAMRIDIVETD